MGELHAVIRFFCTSANSIASLPATGEPTLGIITDPFDLPCAYSLLAAIVGVLVAVLVGGNGVAEAGRFAPDVVTTAPMVTTTASTAAPVSTHVFRLTGALFPSGLSRSLSTWPVPLGSQGCCEHR